MILAEFDHGPIWFRRPGDTQLRALLEAQTDRPLSYLREGITREGSPPPGYRAERKQIELGHGSQTFETAVQYLREWQIHRQAGLRVVARTDAEAGSCVVLSLRVAPVYLSLACRVVYTSEESGRWGFAYGTLEHHVERGEELFVIEQGTGGRVSFTVTSYSRSGHALTALLGPVARQAQRAATARYLTAAKALVARPSG